MMVRRFGVPGEPGAKKETLEHFDMSAYPFGGHHAKEIAKSIRTALAIGGGEATMPKDDKGAVKGDELQLIVAWVEAFERATPAGDHHDHGDQHH